MLNTNRLYIALLLMVLSFGIVNAGSPSEWAALSSDSEYDLSQKIKAEVEKRNTFSTPQEESSNLKMVAEEKTKEDSEYKSSVTNLTKEFSKYKKERDALTTQFQATSTEFEELQKEFKNIKTAIENFDNQIARYEQDIKAQKESFTKWLKTEKQGETVVAVIYTRGFKDVAHELDKQADIISAPLMAAQMGTYVKSHTTVINNTLVKDVVQGTEEGTAKWNGEEPLRIELDRGSKGTVYLRIKRYELYPLQAPESGKVNGKGAYDKMAAGLIQSTQDLETFLSKNGYTPKNLDSQKVGNQINETSQYNRQADSDLNSQSRAFEEKVLRLNGKIRNAKSDKELQLNSLKRKDAPYKKMETELDALRKQRDEAEKLFNEAQSRLSGKKHTRETIIVKTALVTPKGAQTPAEAVAEMVMDKLSEVKNDARVQHTSSTVTVVNHQFAGETSEQAVTEAKINKVRLLSFINEGDSVKVKMAFRVKTVLSEVVQPDSSKIYTATTAGVDSNGKETKTLISESAPSSGGFSLDDLDSKAKEEEKVKETLKAKWEKYLENMKSAFSQVDSYVKRDISKELKIAAWEKYLTSYKEDDPYSTEDEELRDKVKLKKRNIEYANTAENEIEGMVFVRGDCFDMGDTFNEGFTNEKPVHNVCVDDFYIGKYEVTQKQWQDVMGSNPSEFKNCNNCPVENVSWNDTQVYIQKLNAKTGRNYRLPTEAEWEYAARSGGKNEKYAGGNDLIGWYSSNSEGKTHPVGQNRPNGLGLYDMTGNAWELVNDWYGDDYYAKSATFNPKGPGSGKDRVERGGSWYHDLLFGRTSFRDGVKPFERTKFTGFRLAASRR